MRRGSRKPVTRRGSLLIVVLVALSMLSLAAWSFSEAMLGEYRNTRRQAEIVQARMAAESGVQVVCALLETESSFSNESIYDNGLFRGQAVRTFQNGELRFSVVVPNAQDIGFERVRHGLIDESGKLNINLLARIKNADIAREFLMYLSLDMTYEMADAILDWIDQDDKKREYGAELEEYSLEDIPREPPNRPLKSLDELLQVRDVTSDLLYGEDANRNGILDPNERDGDASLPIDNGDNVLDLGWSRLLTVHSRETNMRPDGTLKLNVNAEDLALLYDTIEAEIGEDEAKFIIAYRLYGPRPTAADLQAGLSSGLRPGQSPFNDPNAQQQQPGGMGGEGEPMEAILRGGMDVARGGRFRVNSLFDLVGATVQAQIDDQRQTLESPWPADLDEFQAYGEMLFQTYTTEKGRSFQGRININRAAPELLAGLPGMEGLDDERIEIILAEQIADQAGTFSGSEAEGAFSENVLVRLLLNYPDQFDLALMKSWGPYISTGGRVFRFQVIGHYTNKKAFARIEAVVDGSQVPARVLFQRDLTNLGIGYQRADLGVE